MIKEGNHIKIKKFDEIKREDWKILYGSADWRELNYNYLQMLCNIDQLPYKMIVTRRCIFPFFVTNNINNEIDQIMLSFVKIFADALSVNLQETPIAFLFMPIKVKGFEETEKKELFKELEELSNVLIGYSILIFHEASITINSFKEDIISRKNVSYNTQMVCSFQNFNKYLDSLKSSNRRNIKKSMENFENSGLTFQKIDMSIHKERVQELYENNCSKFGEICEPNEVWNNLANLDNVCWFGIFHNDVLIMFAGSWIEDSYMILAMFGKDYTYEDLIRKTNAYFYINLKLIDYAIKRNIKIIYNGYGEREMKQRLGYNILDYAVTYIKNK